MFGEASCHSMSLELVKSLASYDPTFAKHRYSFGRICGIKKAGVDRICGMLGSDESALGYLSEDDSEAEDESIPAGQVKGKKAPKKWSTVPSAELRRNLGDKVEIRAKVFFRWLRLSRPLITPKLMTDKRKQYQLMNILLGTVCFLFYFVGTDI